MLVVAWMAGVRAQDPQPPGPSRITDIEIPSDREGGEVLELTLLDALRIGRANNLDLKSEQLLPFQREEGLRIEQAFFEPEVFGNVDVARSVSPARNAFQPSITRETVGGAVGLRQRIVSGALFELAFSPSRLRQTTSSTFAFPTKLYSSEIAATVTQPLLRRAWADHALSNVNIADAELAGARSRFERRVQDTLLSVVTAYWNLAITRENYRVVVQALELAREQLRITNERIRVRDLAERDRVSDEAEVARREEERIRAENEVRRFEDELRQLLFDDADGRLWVRNLRPISPIDSASPVPESTWQDLAGLALDHRPDIGALRADVRIAEIEMERAWRDVLPQLDLVGGYSTDGVDQGSFPNAWDDTVSLGFPDWSLSVQFSVPIGNNAARANRDRAVLALERAKRILYAAEVAVAREVRDALRQLTTLAAAIGAARESVRLAETVLDTAQERLRVGRVAIFEVQQRNQELLEARQRLLQNQLDYRVAEATLLHVQGVLHAPAAERGTNAR
jgi:outer membrane protein TolC